MSAPRLRQTNWVSQEFNSHPMNRIALLAGTLGLATFLLLSASSAVQAKPGLAIDATQAGAVGDGVTLDTLAIQKAIDSCNAQGGGTVSFPAGRYLTGTIQLKDNVTLHLDDQAVIFGSTNPADYRNLDPFKAGDGIPQGYALIVADGASNVGIEGAGSIDGQGVALKAAQKKYIVRPFLVRWLRCTGITVKDAHLGGSGAWAMNFFQCKNAAVTHVTIHNRGLVNNDGIDIDSCQTVRISDCNIDSGDDAICLKTTSAIPCGDIIATGCTLTTICNGIKLGTESLGDFTNIQVSQCQLHNIGMAGIALYSVDGANMHNVTISDITMDGVSVPICMRLGARLKTFRDGDQAKPVGTLRDITIQNVRATGIRQIGILINGIPGHPVEALTLENIDLQVPGGGTADEAQVQLPEKEAAYPEYSMFGKVMPAYGIYLRHAQGVSFKNVQTHVSKPDGRPAMVQLDTQNVTPAGYNPTP